jgi:hypothetical protein
MDLADIFSSSFFFYDTHHDVGCLQFPDPHLSRIRFDSVDSLRKALQDGLPNFLGKMGRVNHQ